MYAITGITGQVGGALARRLLEQGQGVRAVLRDPAKGAQWAARGCEVAQAQMDDARALAGAFAGCEGAFILLPPVFDPDAELSASRAVARAVREALAQARPARVVCLSTIGARAREFNLLTQLGLLEEELATLELPVTFLRPAWYMENTAWDLPAARETGVVDSYLQPLARAIPMVATADVGHTAAALLREEWSGKRVVELEGPARVAPADIARALSGLLGKPVRMQAVPRGHWEARFRAQGMRNPLPRMRMLDGFNEGWIAFEQAPRKGSVTLEEVLRALVAR